MNESLQEDILEELDKLPIEQQQWVLDFARALALTKPVGREGKELLHFAGAIEVDDLNTMAQAIEQGCEQINIYEW